MIAMMPAKIKTRETLTAVAMFISVIVFGWAVRFNQIPKNAQRTTRL
jgi:hypothetical protein